MVQTLANRGPDLRFALEAIIKALISKSSSNQVIQLMVRTRVTRARGKARSWFTIWQLAIAGRVICWSLIYGIKVKLLFASRNIIWVYNELFSNNGTRPVIRRSLQGSDFMWRWIKFKDHSLLASILSIWNCTCLLLTSINREVEESSRIKYLLKINKSKKLKKKNSLKLTESALFS